MIYKFIKIALIIFFLFANAQKNYSQNNFQYDSKRDLYLLKSDNFLPLLPPKNKPAYDKNTSLGVLSTKPEFIILAFAGGSIPLNELKGDVTTISLSNGATSSTSYFESWGYNLGITGKLPVGKKGNFRINISLIYNRFFNTGSDSANTVIIEPNLNIFQTGLGAEWAFTKIGDFTPFIGAEFNANIFNGSIDFIEIGPIISYNYNRNVRFGFNAGAGVEYSINKTFGLIGGVKYNFTNLIGKDFDETGAHDLNDDAFTVNGVNIKQKNITFLNFYAGVALYVWD